jgi:hypothetical protein
MKHTQEPWNLRLGRTLINIKGPDGQQIGQFHATKCEEANRIVACINGCAGINPEAVPGLLAALEMMLTIHDCADETGYVADVGFIDIDAEVEKARAAIAAAKEGK